MLPSVTPRVVRRAAWAGVAVAAALGLAPRTARAVEGTEIASAFDEEDPFDLFFGVSYSFESIRGALKREINTADSTDGQLKIFKDLVYNHTRHVITPHFALGVFHDFQLNVALPIVVADQRVFRYDQRAGDCVFTGPDANCVDATTSSTIRDGILPVGGFDAQDPTTNFGAGDDRVFRGVNRSGLDQISLGLTWAILNQERDDTKPNWVLGAEALLSLGQIMRFDMNGDNTGVSRGVHEVRVTTGFSKRTSWAEPFVFFWWQAPFAMRGTDPDDKSGSLFWDVGYGQETKYPMQEAGTNFGFEAIPWEDKQAHQKIGLSLRARVVAHFEGRGYSEMWEILAYGGATPTSPLAVDRDPTTRPQEFLPHPGTTEIENYLSFGGRFGVHADVGLHARFALTLELAHDQRHALTFNDAGRELPGCTGTNQPCETPDDDVVTPFTREVNPLHVRATDIVGRRYILDDNIGFTFNANATFEF